MNAVILGISLEVAKKFWDAGCKLLLFFAAAFFKCRKLWRRGKEKKDN